MSRKLLLVLCGLGFSALGLLAAGCGAGSTTLPSCETDEECADGFSCSDGICREIPCIDADGDGWGEGRFCRGVDCDDTDATVHPDAPERCGDTIDNDCDMATDEGFALLGAGCSSGTGVCAASGIRLCAPDGLSLECDADTTMAGAERCNGLDDDCDGLVDESDGSIDCSCLEGQTQACYTGSADTRMTGSCRDGVQTCLPTGAWGACEGAVEPDTEICNGRDLDCNGLVDDVDQDGDTYFRCPGVSERDCDDDPMAGRNIFPGNLEECNGIDDNCNGLVDEEVLSVYYLDADADGYGGSAANVRACVKPDGFADLSGDCNDSNPDIYPGGTEVCNDADDDCNGLIDDGLALIDIYADNDGDGFAPPGVASRQKCDVPLGFAASQDVDGDGGPDWDCDDSRATINPSAAPRCDGLDNDCDGVVDRWCAEVCPGRWPFNTPSSTGSDVAVADMDEDGLSEIAVGNSGSGFLISNQADVLWRGDGDVNFLRVAGIFADIDATETRGRRTLEWIGAPDSHLRALRLTPAGVVEVPSTLHPNQYDAGSFVAHDFDGDDRAEIVTMDWTGIIRVSGWDSGTDQLIELASTPSPDGTPIYTNGFSLGDVNGDGVPEIVFGTGYNHAGDVGRWSGRVWALAYDAATDTLTDACPGCYDTAIAGLYAAGVSEVLLHDIDGDGDPELQAEVAYYSTNATGVNNTGAGSRLWTFDPATGVVVAGPESAPLRIAYDADRDGTPELHGRGGWTHDVDGDGDLDLIGFTSGRPYLRRLDAGSYDAMPTAVSAPGSLRYLGDLDGDDRLDVLISESTTGRLHCVRFGPGTYNPTLSVGPPMRQTRDMRTGQLDDGEPNDTRESAVYQGNDRLRRAYISSATDADWYRVEAYCMNATIHAPRSHALRVRTYLNVGGVPTPLRDDVVAAGGQQTRTCRDDGSIASPQNVTLWMEIVGEGGSSNTDPYFVRFRDSF